MVLQIGNFKYDGRKIVFRNGENVLSAEYRWGGTDPLFCELNGNEITQEEWKERLLKWEEGELAYVAQCLWYAYVQAVDEEYYNNCGNDAEVKNVKIIAAALDVLYKMPIDPYGEYWDPRYAAWEDDWDEEDRWEEICGMNKDDFPNLPPSPQAGDRLELEIKGVKVAFRYCPPGIFLMGSPEDEAGRRREPRHEVTLTRGFWLGETQVTQRLWKAVYNGHNPSNFQGLDGRPVEEVGWIECGGFITTLNFLGAAPIGMKFDFPTEAEWEYACRAGTTTRYNVGDELTDLDANFGKNIGETTPVKSYPPNAWGLYDMHGNVWEFCNDSCYSASDGYAGRSLTNPTGEDYATYRVIRGGGWNSAAAYCRSASRGDESVYSGSKFVGLRLALRHDGRQFD